MERITIQKVDDAVDNFYAIPTGIYKNIIFYRDINGRTFDESNIAREDGCLYYSYSQFQITKSGNSFYNKRGRKWGFTFNDKKKLSVWFGKNIAEVPGLTELFKYLNMNWLHPNMFPYLTKSIVEKMLAGKITNNLDIIKAYIKLIHLKISAKKLTNCIIENKAGDKRNLLRFIGVAKDSNHLIDYFMNPPKEGSYILNDLVDQARILNRKIDFKWSKLRLEKEHKNWTKEIMTIELEHMADSVVNWIQPLHKFTPKGFILLDTQKKVFEEGSLMKHCVYTNYWSSIKNGNYIAYHVMHPETNEEATLGFTIVNNTLIYNQCYTTYNKHITDDLRKYIEKHTEPLKKKINKLLSKNSVTDRKLVVADVPDF